MHAACRALHLFRFVSACTHLRMLKMTIDDHSDDIRQLRSADPHGESKLRALLDVTQICDDMPLDWPALCDWTEACTETVSSTSVPLLHTPQCRVVVPQAARRSLRSPRVLRAISCTCGVCDILIVLLCIFEFASM